MVHVFSASSLAYFWLPDPIFSLGPIPIPKPVFLFLLFLLIPVQMEIRRLSKRGRFFMIRDYERGQVAAYFWTSTAIVSLLLLTEIGLPQWIAAPAILGGAIGDPLLGELRRYGRAVTFIITGAVVTLIFLPWFAYQNPAPLLVPFLFSVLAAGLVIISEYTTIDLRWKVRPELFETRRRKKAPLRKTLEKGTVRIDDNLLMEIVPAAILTVIALSLFFWGFSLFPPLDSNLIPMLDGWATLF